MIYAKADAFYADPMQDMRKRAPLTPAELAERSTAGKASAAARHRAETTPSVKQGSSGAPSRQAVGLFRQGQSRSDTRSSRSVWDTRATEAPVGSTNASFTFHFPKAYRGTPDRPRLSPKTLALAMALPKDPNAPHHGVAITNPKMLAEAHRHKAMREIIANTINVVRDHQEGTIARGHEKRLIPEGTRPGTVARAYKHAALHALHKAGLGHYDTKMDDAAKAEFAPLVPFIRYAHRRVFDHLNQAQLQGKWGPFRDEYGVLHRQKFHGKYTGKERMRMKPTEFIKINVVDGDLEKGRWTHYSLKDGFKDDGVPTAGNDSPHTLARKAVVAHALGKPIPEPPGGVPAIAGASIKEASQGVEQHFGTKAMDVPRIGGCTRKEPDGLYRVIPIEDLEKLEVLTFPLSKEDLEKWNLGDFNTDPKRQLARAMHPRIRRNKVRLRLNTQRHLRRLLNGGVTRQERWQLGASLGKAYDQTKHPREHDGKFSGKPAERAGRFVGGAGGALAGGLVGLRHGEAIGDRAGIMAGRVYGHAADLVHGIRTRSKARPTKGAEAIGANIGRFFGRRYGMPIGAAAVGLGGFLAGSELGAQLDRLLARRRAKKAGKLDQWKKLNAKVSVRPNNRKQLRRAMGGAIQAGKRMHRIHRTISDLMMAEPPGDLEKSLLAGIAGAAAAGGTAHMLARGLAARNARLGARALYTTGLKDAVRQHLHVFEGGTPSPHITAGRNSAFRGAKAHALKVAMEARKKGLAGIRTKGVTAGAAAIGGLAAGMSTGSRYTMPPLYQSAALNDQPE